MNANIKTSKAGSVTTRREVGYFGSPGEAIFSVNEGIPMSEAFNQLTVLLSSAQYSVEGLTAGDDTHGSACWAPAHLLTFAQALVESMHSGHLAAEKNGGSA